jgi:hypothetical protein
MSLLDEGKANTHLTHLEELVLTQGPKGYDMARAFLLELLEELKGNVDSRVKTSVKWDGAPAIFAGINPENGKFFVGTKSIFNKEPKINYTVEDVQRNHGHAPGLVDKLTKALQYLPPLGIQKILQGDFMFDDEMISTIDVDGEPHYAFKPNTITYAAPVNSKLGQEIAESKFGIVFHTTYDSLDSGASFGADVSGLNKVPGVWVDDAYFTDDTGTVTLTEDEEAKVKELVAAADGVNEKIDYEGLPMDLLNIYINSEIKGGEFLEDPAKSFLGFKRWYSGRLEKRIDNLKSEKGKMRATQKGQEMLASFDDRQEDLLNLFRVSRLLFEAKNIFIAKYNNAVYNTKHFIDDGSGDLVASNPEGYVAVDHIGNGVKFVDRLEFSKANFAIDKGAKFQQTENLTVYWGSDGFSVTKTLLEWARNLPSVENKNQDLYENLLGGAPITSLVREASQVKVALAEAVNWALNEQDQKRVIAIYPGRFQPMGRHHYATYKALADQFGAENTFIVTSNKIGPKSPLDFEEKKKIMVAHGVPADKIVMSRNPYQAVELTQNFDPAGTAVVFAVGGKDMRDSPRFANLDGMTKKGTPAYYKTYRPGEELIGLDKHGYIAVAPHVEIDVPGFGEMSGTTLRKALKGASQEDFETIMGFYNREIYDILQGKLEELSGSGAGGGYSGPFVMRTPKIVGSEKEKKRHPKNFIKEEQEIVTEVMDYLLGISVG